VFRIVASDYISAVLLSPAMRFLQRAAPRIQFDIRLPNEQVFAEFDRGDIDLVLTPEEFVLPNHPAELLLEEKHVVVGWDGNPILTPEFSRADFLRGSHIAVTIGSNRQQTYAERYLERSVGKRRVELFVPNFTLVPWLLVGTTRLAVVHERLAHTFAAHLPLKSVPLPVEIPPMREMVQYHNARTEDDGLTWLRDLLKRMAHESPSDQPVE
jgi:DNA-binding transcriptional LysR family regulator